MFLSFERKESSVLSKRKYFGSLLILCISALAALSCLPGLLAPLAVVACSGGAFALVLKSIFGAALQARRRHESLLTLIKDQDALNKVKFDEEAAHGSQLERLVGQVERAVISLGDAAKGRDVDSDEITRRATIELKLKIIDDLAAVRELLEKDVEFPVVHKSSELLNNEF